MPVSPVPPSRSSRDNDALAGRGGLVGGSRGSVSRQVGSGPSAGEESGLTEGAGLPALVADDGRGAVTLLNEARDRALHVGNRLDHLATAGTGVARVQKLMERLSDVAVVASDRSVQPSERATLQRQIDLALAEIDTVADETPLDQLLVQRHVGSTPADDSSPLRPTPFRAIGTAALGLGKLAVRSSDQALAAIGALDLAASRLDRRASSLRLATARLEAELDDLTRPDTTATGDAALGNGTFALSSAMLLRRQLVSHPDGAVQAQSGLEVARVMRLLDSSAR